LNKNLPKNIILPALIGAAFYFLLLFAENRFLVSQNQILTWIGVILGAITMYGIAIGTSKNAWNIELFFSGLRLSSIFFGILICLILYGIGYFYESKEKKFDSLLEKNGINLVSDNKKCINVKYGIFTNGFDTINRYREKGQDFESIKSNSFKEKYRIKWIDSCMYIRIENQSAITTTTLGNFENDTHYAFIRPSALHYIEEESYQMIIKIED